MKKLLFLLFLLPFMAMAQVSTGQEQDFDYGIKNNSSQQILTPDTLVTKGVDGTYGHTSAYRLPISNDTYDSLQTKVPYTGAASNVDLGEFGLKTGNLKLDLTPTSIPTEAGTIYWDNINKTLSLIDGVGATALQIGQEERTLIHNSTGATLTDGQVVYVTGSTGALPSVSLASATIESTSAATLGVVTESIPNGSSGFVSTTGIVNGLNTLAFNEGDILWLSNTAGEFTNVKPVSPSHLVLIGYVIKKAGGNGSVLVKIQNTQELAESSDVLFGTLANNDLLVYESSTGLWKNKQLSTLLGGTGSQFVKGNGSLDSTTYATQSALNTEVTNRTNADASTLVSANNYTDAGLATKQNALTNPVTGTGTTNYLPKFTGANAIGNSQIIDNGTNVGIGTSSPSSKLTLTNGFNFAHINGGNSNTSPFLAILNTSDYSAATYGWGIFDNSTNGNLDIKRYNGSTTASDVMTLQRSLGNVGIGTTSPSAKLHIQDTNGGIFFDGSGATYNRFKSTTSSASVGRDLLFSTQNSGTTPDLYINSVGNVLIGTTTDNGVDKLQVNGTVSSGNTTLGTSQPTANNQLTRKDYVDTALALKANLASPTFTGTPTAPTATAGTNTTQVATTAFVQSGFVPQIKITTTTSITTATVGSVTGLGQQGRNVVIDNGSNVINLTVNGTDGFCASYLKHGTGNITFVQGSGRTLIQVDGTAVLSGAVGSTATISSVGTTDYLMISNK